MTAGFHHFVIEQGATFSKVLTLKDSSDAVVDLTGYLVPKWIYVEMLMALKFNPYHK